MSMNESPAARSSWPTPDVARVHSAPRAALHAGRFLLSFERPLIMGIINVTPDSFSDGGKFLDSRRALDHAKRLLEDGADILDIGGESSRPGAQPIPLDEELGRVLPVLEQLVR